MLRRGWLIVAFAIALLMGFFAWEWYLSPEARARRVIEGAAAAAEATDIGLFLDYFAEDYSDYLHQDLTMLEERAREGFARVDRLNVTVRAIEVDASESGDDASASANARFDLIVVAVRGEERYVVVGTPFEPEKISASLVGSPEGWKLRRVDRGAAGSSE